MRLTLGTRSLDLARRALVVGPPGEDPDIVELVPGDDRPPTTDAVLAARVDGSPPATAAALRAGAVLIGTSQPEAPLDDLLPACARAGATVVVSGTGARFGDVRMQLVACARQAEAAGLPPDRIVVEAPLTPLLLPHLGRFAELGYPLLLTVTRAVVRSVGGNHPGLSALAVVQGARLIRTDEVTAATRACRVVSAILGTR